jgi:ribosomal protein L37E
MKTYCRSCGGLATYKAGHKPAFCSSCGSPIDKKQTEKKKKREIEDKSQAEYDEEDIGEDDMLYVPDISKLDFDIKGDWKQKSETLGSILPSVPEPEDE